MRRILLLLACFLIIITMVGCARITQDSSAMPDDPPAIPAEPIYTHTGVTGGTYSFGGCTVTIPSGAIPSGLSANPTLTQTTPDTSQIISGDETIISNSFDLNTNAIDDIFTTGTIEVTIPFNPSSVPPANLCAPYVYVKVYYPDIGASLPLVGTISGSNITINMRGLGQHAIFSVVYNPDMRIVLSDSLGASSIYSASTRVPPWETNRWALIYNPNYALLKNTVATIRGTTAALLTNAQIDATVKSLINNNAAAAGAIYQTAGFRQPNLEISRNAVLLGTTEAAYLIYLTNDGSFFSGAAADDNVARRGFAHGTLYIDPTRMLDAVGSTLGSIKASLAHEMLHSIQSGYDLSYSNNLKGYKEGTAATYGLTIDQAAAEPQVRTAEQSEQQKLSTFLGCERQAGQAYDYANQDFFAYVGRKYHSNSLSYIKDFFEQLRSDVAAQVTATGSTDALLAPTKKQIRTSLNTSFNSLFHKSLATVYFDYACDRAIEHSALSKLRTDDPTTANTLNERLFHNAAIYRQTVDPDYLRVNSITGTSSNLGPFSSQVIVITPSKVGETGTNPTLTITPSIGSLGTSLKAALYRRGVKTDINGAIPITNIGSVANDILYVLISNIDLEHDITVTYRLGANATPINTFEATATINGVVYPYNAAFYKGMLGEYTSAPYHRTDLPSIYSNDSGSFADLNCSIISIFTNPDKISTTEANVYNFGDGYNLLKPTTTTPVLLGYFNPAIRNADTNDIVGFSSTGGTLAVGTYSKTVGGRLIANFSATVIGTRETVNTASDADKRYETLTGTVSGSFDVELENFTP